MKFFSLSKNHVAIMITLFVVIFFGAIYFFVYVPQNEKNVQEQRFRTLQQIDRNIHANISNGIAMMNNLALAYYRDPNDDKIARYIDSFPKEHFTVYQPEGPIKAGSMAKSDTGSRIRVDNLNHEIRLEVFNFFDQKDRKKGAPLTRGTGIYHMWMVFSFDQFTRFLLPKDVFDEYIVFSNGQVAYETFPSGISYTKDSLLGRNNGINSATVRNLTAGGVDYKLFLQPISLTADSVWVVGGLLTSKSYQLEKNQLPSNIILLLTTIMLMIVVAFPWLKLYQMGSRDRLTIRDGISTIVVSMLLMSLLFFTLFKYNTLFRGELKDSKDPLSAAITTAFGQELDSARNLVYEIDRRVKSDPKRYFRDTINLGRSDTLFRDLVLPLKDTAGSLSLNQVFWLDADGNEAKNWIADAVHAPHGKFNNRDYFKRIRLKQFYERGQDSTRPFYLDQVISWNSGVFTSVLSIPSQVPGMAVAAISFNMKSLRQPVLPAGYEFALIDDQGNVLYHSDGQKNLRENLIQEFSAKQALISNISARTEANFRTLYFGSNYNVSIKPIRDLPYYMVILGSVGFKETRDLEIFSFSFTMLFILFGLLVFQLLVVFLAASRHSFFKKQLYETSWVAPKISAHPEYNQGIVFNLVIITLTILYSHHSSFLTYLYILCFSITSLPIFLNKLFALKYRRIGATDNVKFKHSSLWTLGIFIVIIDAFAFSSLEAVHFRRVMLYEVIVALVWIVMWWRGGTIVEYIGKGFGLFARILPKRKPTWDYTYSFTMMALTRLIITSGIPVAFFYISSYNFEQNIGIRYRQLQYVKELQQKQRDSSAGLTLTDRSFSRGYYLDSAWIRDVRFTEGIGPGRYSPEDALATRILAKFHIYLTSQSVLEDRFFEAASGDSSFFYIASVNGKTEKDSVTSTYLETGVPGRYLTVSAASLNYKVPPLRSVSGIPGIYYYIIFVLTLLIFFYVIYKILGKIFCFNLPNLSLWNRLDERIMHNKEVNRLLFVIGLPGSGKLTRILEKIRNGEIQTSGDPLVYDHDHPEKSNVFIADLIQIPDSQEKKASDSNWVAFRAEVFNRKYRLIIVNHFEYNIQDAGTNREKLNFLEELMRENRVQLIILSTIHPVAFLDSVLDPGAKANDQSIPGQDLQRWHVLLGHYRIIVMPMEQALESNKCVTATRTQCTTTDTDTERCTETVITTVTTLSKNLDTTETTVTQAHEAMATETTTVIRTRILSPRRGETVPAQGVEYSLRPVYQEMGQTHFLRRLQRSVLEVAATMDEEERAANGDELAFKLQVTSHYFYMYIWQSLTKEEKFLLYDLAEDNLVNAYDDYNLNMLLAKGVIIRPDGVLKLFNKGFRNFILTAIGNSEAMKIQNHIHDNGNWNKLKTPLLIVILAILTFLFSSQEEAYSKMIAYAAALAAGVPTVLKIFSLFGTGEKKE